MSKFQHDVMLRIVKILNVLMIELPFAACWFLYYSHQTYANLAWEGHFAILGLFFILYIALGKIYDAFWMSMQRVSELVYGQILGAMATDGILYIVICLMSAKFCNLLPGIAAIAGQLVMAAIWASCAHKWYYKTFPPQKTAVVYDVRHGMEIFTIDKSRALKYLGHLTPEEMRRVDDAVRISLALNPMGSIQQIEPIRRSTAVYAPPEVVDGKPPVYPYTPIKSSFENAGSIEEMMLYTELQSAVHAMIQRLEYSFTFNPSLLTIPKRKQQVAEILEEAEKYIWRIKEEMRCA